MAGPLAVTAPDASQDQPNETIRSARRSAADEFLKRTPVDLLHRGSGQLVDDERVVLVVVPGDEPVAEELEAGPEVSRAEAHVEVAAAAWRVATA